ncbi:MAG: amino acid ABC transporter substrate-binding protein [Aeropyrum sp.]|nr:amino acid ABC transporter substrate-binding protein [Aeropyrum sp.]MCE4615739.1 amino acid ABC transporter substrate-binding protein [Aeropyrum sp.]
MGESRNQLLLAGAALLLAIIIIGAAFFILGDRGEEGATATETGAREGAEAGETPAEEVETLVIGAPLSLSGKYAKEGEMSLMGALAVVNWINDQGGIKVGGKTYKLEFIFYDDESNPDRVVSLVEKLIAEDNVNFLLAPYSSGLTAKAAPIAEKYGAIMLSHGGASDKIFTQGYEFIVQILTPASRYFVSVLDMVKAIDPEAKTVAIVYKESEFARTVAEGAKSYAESLGFEVVYFKSYPADAQDLTPVLQPLKDINPDVLIGGGHFADGQLLARQLYELGIKPKLIGLLVAPAIPDFYDNLGEAAEGIVYPSQWEPKVKYSPDNVPEGYEWYGPTVEEFIQYFKEVARERGKGDIMPSYHAADAGAAILFLAKAIEKAGSLDPEKVREAMNDLALYTFYGKLKIDPETGLQVGHDMVVGQWQNGKKVIVWPREASEADPLYPLPGYSG